MEKLIQRLVEAPGPPGSEKAVRGVILELIGDRQGDARVDALGNLIVRRSARREGAARVLVTAPMDEIGLMVSHVHQDGFVRFATLGEPDHEGLVGQRVRFLDGPSALIGSQPSGQGSSMPGMGRFFLDFGLGEGAKPPVAEGDLAVFDATFGVLGERVTGKALKDRAGVAVLVETLRHLGETPHEIVFAFTVQGQIGSRGAPAVAYEVQPDIGLAVSVAPGNDLPGAEGGPIALGGGPVLLIRDREGVSDAKLIAWLSDVAEEQGLSFQTAVTGGRASEAQALRQVRSGARTAALQIPGRYLNSASEMVDLGDLEQTVRLLGAALEGLIPL